MYRKVELRRRAEKCKKSIIINKRKLHATYSAVRAEGRRLILPSYERCGTVFRPLGGVAGRGQGWTGRQGMKGGRLKPAEKPNQGSLIAPCAVSAVSKPPASAPKAPASPNPSNPPGRKHGVGVSSPGQVCPRRAPAVQTTPPPPPPPCAGRKPRLNAASTSR